MRRRLLGSSPAILEQAVLPLSLVSSLDSKKLAAGESMYQFLADRYGLQDDYSEQSLEVVPPTQVEREALELGPREQVSYTFEG